MSPGAVTQHPVFLPLWPLCELVIIFTHSTSIYQARSLYEALRNSRASEQIKHNNCTAHVTQVTQDCHHVFAQWCNHTFMAHLIFNLSENIWDSDVGAWGPITNDGHPSRLWLWFITCCFTPCQSEDWRKRKAMSPMAITFAVLKVLFAWGHLSRPDPLSLWEERPGVGEQGPRAC